MTRTPLIIFHIKKWFKFRNHCALREPFVISVCFVSSISFLQIFFFCMRDRHDAFAPCEGIQCTVGFWIPRLGFRIPNTVHVFSWWNLFSVFQSLVGFWIPQEKFSRIPISKGKNQEGRNPESFTWGRYISQRQHWTEDSLGEMINTIVLDKDEPWLPLLW